MPTIGQMERIQRVEHARVFHAKVSRMRCSLSIDACGSYTVLRINLHQFDVWYSCQSSVMNDTIVIIQTSLLFTVYNFVSPLYKIYTVHWMYTLLLLLLLSLYSTGKTYTERECKDE